MYTQKPLVSVSMITFHAQDFIAEAIEGVLSQKVDFPIELVIGDDCSRDRTRAICAEYAAKYPDIIRILPEEKNLGIAGNTARTMDSCTGKYIAVCDGDDVWTDPFKLQKQVAFLEKNPDYGLVYSDVETISEVGKPVKDSEQDAKRTMYDGGDIFLKLIQSNFINNSTVLFRRDFLDDHYISPDRSYQIPDYLCWVFISARAKVHFINEKTTAYRRFCPGQRTETPKALLNGNRLAFQRNLFEAIVDFDRYKTRELTATEKHVMFRNMLRLFFCKAGSLKNRWQLIWIMPRYFPGTFDLLKTGITKLLAPLTTIFHLSKLNKSST